MPTKKAPSFRRFGSVTIASRLCNSSRASDRLEAIAFQFILAIAIPSLSNVSALQRRAPLSPTGAKRRSLNTRPALVRCKRVLGGAIRGRRYRPLQRRQTYRPCRAYFSWSRSSEREGAQLAVSHSPAESWDAPPI